MTTRRRARILATLLSIVTAVVVFFIATKLFPYHSLNHDEGVYLQQAAMLIEGNLFLHPPVPDAFRPWFFVRDGGRLFPKYAPVPAAMFALGTLAGNARLSLAAIAAANVGLTYAITTESFDRRTGVIAAILLATSPLFIVDSAIFLPYAPTTLWNLLFAFAYFRSARLESRGYSVLAGSAIGISFFSRPYTAILFAAPFVVHALHAARATWFDRDVVSRLTITGVTGLFGVGITLGYNAIVTGSPFVFPYEAFAPLDGLGFGHRKLLDYEQQYTVGLALRSNAGVLAALFTRWVAGGILGTGLAAVGLVAGIHRSHSNHWRDRFTQNQARAILAGLFVSIPLGNVYFWGNRNIVATLSDPNDGLIHFLGPYYHFDILLPMAVFGAFGAITLSRWLRNRVDRFVRTRRTRTVFVTILVLSASVFAGVTASLATAPLQANATVTDQYQVAYEPVENRSFENALVFVPTTHGDWLNHPFQSFRNDPGFDGEVVYALDGPRRFAVVDSYPNRTLYRYVYRGQWEPYSGTAVEPRLQRVRAVRGDSVSLHTTVGLPQAVDSASIRLASDEGDTYYVADGDDSARFRLVVSDGRARLDGSTVRSVGNDAAIPVGRTDTLAVEVYVENADGTGFSYIIRLPVERRDGTIRALSPYRGLCRVPRNCGDDGITYLPDETRPDVSLTTRLNGSA
ncbi:ArnT family glycosyltransferase [Haladaptatus caseinilyticus]|uniref:ArnT family glycosyltransferase n=1 Tax=Haladaptatus caseinilyticus TaxID=2993314 RepID=UPI00224AFB69|nr:glycosyltransferase family 39 protein [Haladaptatus caseinilyticus]